jgi:hypothetical protein
MSKLKTDKIVEAMKAASKILKAKVVEKPTPTHRERDMRQEAMDMGAHGAMEYFGNPEEGVSDK